jgi:hypothetical protein
VPSLGFGKIGSGMAKMKSVLWLVLVCLLTTGLVLSSCNKNVPEASPKAETAETAVPTLPQMPELRPASFIVSSLTITPMEVTTGSSVTIEVLVTNSGELSGTYDVLLEIDDIVEATEKVTLEGGASQKVNFTKTKSTAKTYSVSINGQSGAFVVKALSPPSPPTPSAIPFNFRSVLFGQPSSLDVFLQSIDRISGKVVVNGGDSRCPSIPFTFNWGDDKTTDVFFPASHTYSDTNINYLVTVTAHYDNRTTDSIELGICFVAPLFKPVSLPEDVRVTILTSLVSLTSRMPGYAPPSRLTVFDDSHFGNTPRSTVEYVLTLAASIQKDFANDDVYLVDGGFRQVALRDPEFGGMYSLWFTSPVSFGVSTSAFQGTVQYSSLMHEMGHNVTLNSPADYWYGGKIDGNANSIFSETMAQIFQHATAYYLINNYQTYGLSEDLVADIRENALASMSIVRNSYESYLSGGKRFASWNDPLTLEDETFNTFMTIAYKFFEHAENGLLGYRIPLKRMMVLLQTFDEDMKNQYDQFHDTEAAAMFRSTLMVAAVSYAFETDLRSEFRALNFPISDSVYDGLYNKAGFRLQ